MAQTIDEWLDALLAALADARAALACFGVHETALEARLDKAMAEAQALKKNAWGP